MDWWQTIEHRVRLRLHALSERLLHPGLRGRVSVGRFWSSERGTGATDLARIFAAAESVPPPAASDAIEEGRLVLRFTAAAGATLTVTEIAEGDYLCCYEPSSTWLSRSSAEATYYRFVDHSWLDLADALVPLFALEWDLDHATTTGSRQRQLTGDEQSSTERLSRSGEENERGM